MVYTIHIRIDRPVSYKISTTGALDISVSPTVPFDKLSKRFNKYTHIPIYKDVTYSLRDYILKIDDPNAYIYKYILYFNNPKHKITSVEIFFPSDDKSRRYPLVFGFNQEGSETLYYTYWHLIKITHRWYGTPAQTYSLKKDGSFLKDDLLTRLLEELGLYTKTNKDKLVVITDLKPTTGSITYPQTGPNKLKITVKETENTPLRNFDKYTHSVNNPSDISGFYIGYKEDSIFVELHGSFKRLTYFNVYYNSTVTIPLIFVLNFNSGIKLLKYSDFTNFLKASKLTIKVTDLNNYDERKLSEDLNREKEEVIKSIPVLTKRPSSSKTQKGVQRAGPSIVPQVRRPPSQPNRSQQPQPPRRPPPPRAQTPSSRVPPRSQPPPHPPREQTQSSHLGTRPQPSPSRSNEQHPPELPKDRHPATSPEHSGRHPETHDPGKSSTVRDSRTNGEQIPSLRPPPPPPPPVPGPEPDLTEKDQSRSEQQTLGPTSDSVHSTSQTGTSDDVQLITIPPSDSTTERQLPEDTLSPVVPPIIPPPADPDSDRVDSSQEVPDATESDGTLTRGDGVAGRDGPETGESTGLVQHPQSSQSLSQPPTRSTDGVSESTYQDYSETTHVSGLEPGTTLTAQHSTTFGGSESEDDEDDDGFPDEEEDEDDSDQGHEYGAAGEYVDYDYKGHDGENGEGEDRDGAEDDESGEDDRDHDSQSGDNFTFQERTDADNSYGQQFSVDQVPPPPSASDLGGTRSRGFSDGDGSAHGYPTTLEPSSHTYPNFQTQIQAHSDSDQPSSDSTQSKAIGGSVGGVLTTAAVGGGATGVAYIVRPEWFILAIKALV